MAWREVSKGRVENGHLHINNLRKLELRLARRRNCDVVVTIEKLYAHRTKPMNDYWWAVIVARVQTKFLEKGIIQREDPQLVHEILKSQFMDPELIRLGRIRGFISDTGLAIGTSTTDLSTLEFMELWDRVSDHAAQYWDLYLPPPDPNWRENAERAEEEERAAAENRPSLPAGEMESEL